MNFKISDSTGDWLQSNRFTTICGEFEMISLKNNPYVQEPEHGDGINWIGGTLILLLCVIGIWIGSKVYWINDSEKFRSAVFGIFTLMNSVRILAYVPQILAAARDANGASGISYSTWTLFMISHLTTITYAVVCLDDVVMSFIFLGNALACLTIIVITFVKRQQYSAKLMERV